MNSAHSEAEEVVHSDGQANAGKDGRIFSEAAHYTAATTTAVGKITLSATSSPASSAHSSNLVESSPNMLDSEEAFGAALANLMEFSEVSVHQCPVSSLTASSILEGQDPYMVSQELSAFGIDDPTLAFLLHPFECSHEGNEKNPHSHHHQYHSHTNSIENSNSSRIDQRMEKSKRKNVGNRDKNGRQAKQMQFNNLNVHKKVGYEENPVNASLTSNSTQSQSRRRIGKFERNGSKSKHDNLIRQYDSVGYDEQIESRSKRNKYKIERGGHRKYTIGCDQGSNDENEQDDNDSDVNKDDDQDDHDEDDDDDNDDDDDDEEDEDGEDEDDDNDINSSVENTEEHNHNYSNFAQGSRERLDPTHFHQKQEGYSGQIFNLPAIPTTSSFLPSMQILGTNTMSNDLSSIELRPNALANSGLPFMNSSSSLNIFPAKGTNQRVPIPKLSALKKGEGGNSSLPFMIPSSSAAVLATMSNYSAIKEGHAREMGVDFAEEVVKSVEERKVMHKVSEKRRRNDMKMGYSELKTLVPLQKGRKDRRSSKATILLDTVDFIKDLQHQLAHSKVENDHLKEENQELRKALTAMASGIVKHVQTSSCGTTSAHAEHSHYKAMPQYHDGDHTH